MKLLKTITSIFKSKSRKLNRKLQVSNCIDLIDEQQASLAEAYKKLCRTIADLEIKRDAAVEKVKKEKKAEIKAIVQKNVDLINSTIERLKSNKKRIAEKLEKTEDSRVVLVAKKSLLDSIESLKDTSSNVFQDEGFDVEAIMAEIDTSIAGIEAEFKADEELNELVK
jgi:hypothetical protein